MSVMQKLDSKQIEAHCEHVGFENISTEDAVYTDKKNGKEYPTLVVICYKPGKQNDNNGENKNISKKQISYTNKKNKK